VCHLKGQGCGEQTVTYRNDAAMKNWRTDDNKRKKTPWGGVLSLKDSSVEDANTPAYPDADYQSGQLFHFKIKRLSDIVGASVGLLILLPVMLLVAVVIKRSSPGPVFFTQKRVGFKGKLFIFLKFRTMLQGCDEEMHRDYVAKLIKGELQKPMHKLVNDSRITKIGSFLRAWSLDELPQLINVLRGEMSLVGPRPAIPYEVENYLPWHMRRLDALPGITGLWQVTGRSTMTFDEMVHLDIHYITNWSLWLDIKILWQTFPAVLNRNGAA